MHLENYRPIIRIYKSLWQFAMLMYYIHLYFKLWFKFYIQVNVFYVLIVLHYYWLQLMDIWTVFKRYAVATLKLLSVAFLGLQIIQIHILENT